MRAADGWTLFLDEVGDLPLSAQTALLRVLQEREVLPLGATRAVSVDFRLISATHRDLGEAVFQERFRADLLGRIRGFSYELLPLRSRMEDLGVLVSNILRERAKGRAERLSFRPAAVRRLLRHPFPNNVRELEQALATALALAPTNVIEEAHLVLSDVPSERSVMWSEAELELRKRLIELFAEHGGNVSAVARAMGKARTQVQRWGKTVSTSPDARWAGLKLPR